MSRKKICFVAQFPPPMHGLSKAVETLYNSELNNKMNSNSELEFEKVNITNNKQFLHNLIKISKSRYSTAVRKHSTPFFFTIPLAMSTTKSPIVNKVST